MTISVKNHMFELEGELFPMFELEGELFPLTRAMMGSGELHVLIGGVPKSPPSVSSKVRVVE